MHYLDIDSEDLEDAADIIASATSVVPRASYPHPDKKNFHRMEFELRENRDTVKAALRRFEIETFVA